VPAYWLWSLWSYHIKNPIVIKRKEGEEQIFVVPLVVPKGENKEEYPQEN